MKQYGYEERAARFVTDNYSFETGSMTGILEKLELESLKEKRKESRLIMLSKGLNGAASLSTNDVVPPIRHIGKDYSLTLHTPLANTDTYKCSVFPQTIRDWNFLTDPLILAAECVEDLIT